MEKQKTSEKSKEKCEDKKCPFHGNVKPRGRVLKGTVLAKDTHRTATIERRYSIFIPKYERSETRISKIHVHNPSCIDAEIGDIVLIAETRPLSKTKNFVIIKKIGKEKGFAVKLEAREEAKVEEKKKEETQTRENDKTTKETETAEEHYHKEDKEAEGAEE